MALWEKKKVLVTVKAYPQDSKKYSETVCTAGICLDTKRWIRLYPVPFRSMDPSKQFKKYDILDVEVSVDGSDGRPESHRLREDTLAVAEHFDTEHNWKKRKEFVIPTLSESMCAIQREQELSGKSLGAFKLRRPKDFHWAPVDLSQETDDAFQLTLFDTQKKELYKLPFDFRYKYKCDNEPGCKGHDQKILDWELGEAVRTWPAKYGSEAEGFKKIKDMWLDTMFADDNDATVFVGNHHFHRNAFMVLGVFYPKHDGQLSLF